MAYQKKKKKQNNELIYRIWVALSWGERLPKGCPACPRRVAPAVSSCASSHRSGVPGCSLGSRGVALLPVWLHWYLENQGNSWHLFVPLVITQHREIRDWKWTVCLRSGRLSARFMEVWFLISLLCRRKSDNFAFQYCQSNAFPRLFTCWKVDGGKGGSLNICILQRRTMRRCLIAIWS